MPNILKIFGIFIFMAFDPKKRLAQMKRAAKRLPKSPEQKQRYLESQAKKMDKNQTGCEEIFENMLIDLKIKYESQKILHGKIFDFFVPNKNIIFEIDGNYWHGYGLTMEQMNDVQRKTHVNDKKKTLLAEGSGYKLVRIWEHELEDEFYEVTKEKIRVMLK